MQTKLTIRDNVQELARLVITVRKLDDTRNKTLVLIM